MSGLLRVAVLGPMQAWVDGQPVELGPARQQAVFAALVLHANRTVTVGALLRRRLG